MLFQISKKAAQVGNRLLMSGFLVGCALVVVGCGGSGAGANGSATNNLSTDGTGASISTTGASITLGLIEVASNTDKNSISLSSATQLRALLKDGAGQPIANQIVKFAAGSDGVLIFTPAASALTDATGLASVFASPASITTAGAYSVTAESTVAGASFKATRSFSIGVSNVTISALTASAPTISAYGTTTVSATIAGLPEGATVKVQFTSTCASNGKAVLTEVSDTVNGIATATYKDNACASADTITATVQGSSASKNTSVTSSAPAVANIGFVSSSPETIVLKGTGSAGASEVSIVRFTIFDQNGKPYTTPTPVTLNLSTFTGGMAIDNNTTAVTKSSNAVGVVEVTVAAGTVPTPVTVTASIVDPVSGQTRTTESAKLNISTGRPSQSFFSLSASKLNIEGWGYDGEKSVITVRAADRLANPVPNGTGVNFIAEGASIQPTCQTTGGACSVEFVSQESRPRDNITDPSTSIDRSNAGRVTVVSYSIGEESFVDLNGNNQFDPATETFTDLGFIYVDNLETATYNPSTHQVIPFTTPQGACVSSPVGVFSVPSKPNTCDGKWGTAHVRRATVIVLSGSTPRFAAVAPGGGPATYGVNSLPFSIALNKGSCNGGIPFYLQDENGNPMAGGTTLTVDGALAKDVTFGVGATPIAESTARGGTYNFISVNGNLDATTGTCKASGSLKLTVASTKGVLTAYSFSISVAP